MNSSISTIDKDRLRHALTIKDPKQESIFGIIGRMEVLLELFQKYKAYRGLVPFLKTYYLITKKVAQKSIQYSHFFDDSTKLEQLDVHFASLYFTPLKQYLINGSKAKPWKTYFDYAERKSGSPFLQMLLGINAHINGDLACSMASIKYGNHSDFLIINKILKEEIPDVLSFLAFVEKDFYSFGSMIFRKFFDKEFNKVIVKWRICTWHNAELLRKDEITKKQLSERTEDLARELIDLYYSPYKLFKAFIYLKRLNHLHIKH